MSEVIVIDSAAWKKLLSELQAEIKRCVREVTDEIKGVNLWVPEAQARAILNVKSRSKMWQLREENYVVYSQQYGRNTLYYVPSLYKLIERNANQPVPASFPDPAEEPMVSKSRNPQKGRSSAKIDPTPFK